MKRSFYFFLGMWFGVFFTGCISVSVVRSVTSRNNETVYNGEFPSETRSLPPFGKGYRTYSFFGTALGRQYAHDKVISVLRSSFRMLHEETGRVFEVAEIGWRKGGSFVPHKTHKFGLSVDIMTPMKTAKRDARLLTGPLSLWGYCWHIDDKTHRVDGYKWDAPKASGYPRFCPRIPFPSKKEVDFDAIVSLVKTLHSEAKKLKGGVRYVIVDPSFVSKLKGIQGWLTTKSKLEHDDHIHVEFRF